ncbi:MAG TPA: carbohydrate ABC transporter permease [Firmicutes bacterium]|nr:carbohydrate ABC transporter permease [Bacillota bacterium]
MYLILVVGVLITAFPFYWMFILATLSRSEIFSFPPTLWFGSHLVTNYKNLLEFVPFLRNIWNSFYIASMATFTTLFFCSLGAYGFSFYDFKGKDLLFGIMLGTMMIPGVLNTIPWFIMMRWFGWINQPRALYVGGMANAFGIFLLRQYMESAIPRELQDAARIDGCGEFEIYWRIVLPLSGPGLGALGMVTFIGSWNDFMGALIIMKERATYTVPLALRSLQGEISTDYGAVMFGTALGVLPILIVFLLASQQIISGLTAGAIKG